MGNKELIKAAYTFSNDLNCSIHDRYGRSRNFASDNQNVFTPFVSYQLISDGYQPSYPDGKEFAISFSHDIDLLSKFKMFTLHGRIKQLYKKTNLNIKAVEQALYKRVLIDENDPRRFLEISKKYDIATTFYFLALAESQADFNYDMPFVTDLIKEIVAANSEVSLHGSHEAYNNREQIAIEKSRLSENTTQKLTGYRNHYLRFKVPDTWHHLVANDFAYDSTYGNPDVAGFRNGMSHPFLPYDISTNSFIDILEIPLIIMDTTLFDYMRLSEEAALELCKTLIDEVRKTKGAVSILWHNHYLRAPWLSFYEKLVQYCVESNAWLPTAGSLNNWWRSNDFHKQQVELMKPYLVD